MFLGSALPEWDAEMPTHPGLSPETGPGAAGAREVQLDPLTETRPKGGVSGLPGQAFPVAFSSLCLNLFLWVRIN